MRFWLVSRSATAKLYYVNNATGMPPASLEFEAVTTKVLLNFSGTQAEPITNVSVRGMTLRDTAYTYLDPHGADGEKRHRFPPD
jgi:hypothetical protein